MPGTTTDPDDPNDTNNQIGPEGINGTPIVKCQYAEEQNRGVRLDGSNNRFRTLKFTVVVNLHLMDGWEVLRWCERLSDDRTPDPVWSTLIDPIPPRRTYYNALGTQDQSTFVNDIQCHMVHHDQDLLWEIVVEYGPPTDAGIKLVNYVPLSDDPMRWPIIPWVELLEYEKVAETGFCVTDLELLRRGIRYTGNEPGPIINAASQQTIDPLTYLAHRLQLKFKINYPSNAYAQALQQQFEGTFHGPRQMLYDENGFALSAGKSPWVYWQQQTLFGGVLDSGQADVGSYNFSTGAGILNFLQGSPHGTWKFVSAEPEQLDWRTLDNGEIIQFCPTTITLEKRLGEVIDQLPSPYRGPAFQGWLDLVLNNGQTCYAKWMDGDSEKWIPDPRYKDPLTGQIPYLDSGNTIPRYRLNVPTVTIEFVDEFDSSFTDPKGHDNAERVLPKFPGDLIRVPSAEPMNLDLEGKQIFNPYDPNDPLSKPVHIGYCILRPANYFDITDYYGNAALPHTSIIPTFPLSPPPVL